MQGLVESATIESDDACFSSLILNTTSVNVEIYYNKAVNYTLVVTFVSSVYTSLQRKLVFASMMIVSTFLL